MAGGSASGFLGWRDFRSLSGAFPGKRLGDFGSLEVHDFRSLVVDFGSLGHAGSGYFAVTFSTGAWISVM